MVPYRANFRKSHKRNYSCVILTLSLLAPDGYDMVPKHDAWPGHT